MLQSLAISNILLIDRLDLTFQPGLSALTGETGVGKSILLDALGLVLGARADGGLVRTGFEQGIVSAKFLLTVTALALLNRQGIEIDENTVLVRRVVNSDGRSRAFINDHHVSVQFLRTFGASLAEIHCQAEQYRLLDSASNRVALDIFAANKDMRAAVSVAYANWQEIQKAATALASSSAAVRQHEDYVRYAVEELNELAPQEGEETQLARNRTLLQQQAKLDEALRKTIALLGGERGAESLLREAISSLVHLRLEGLEGPISAFERAALELTDGLTALKLIVTSKCGEKLWLEEIEERLFALRALARKHRVGVEQLRDVHTKLLNQLENITLDEAKIEHYKTAVVDARSRFIEAAARLTDSRVTAAQQLDLRIAAELLPLKLESARFKTLIEQLDESSWSAAGVERVVFTAATNPGASLAPLARIASGGELARFMLALKVVIASKDSTPILIFDEIDSGVGGATATAVGERLARLGDNQQVLVVTHSPQVAARAHHHWCVIKEIREEKARMIVVDLDPEARREEIARMLSGETITEAARQAAGSLLAGSS